VDGHGKSELTAGKRKKIGPKAVQARHPHKTMDKLLFFLYCILIFAFLDRE